MLFCVQIHGSTGWISWPARDWREATTPPSLWNGTKWVYDQFAALTRAGCCPVDDTNVARVMDGGRGVHEVYGVYCSTSQWPVARARAKHGYYYANQTEYKYNNLKTI